MSITAEHDQTRTTRLSLHLLDRLLVAMTATVIGLGVFQEVYTRHFGEETLLRGMPQIALDGEMNVGAWYTSSLMVASALVLFLTGRAVRDVSGGRGALPWYCLAVIFVGLSIDEAASFHEILGTPLRNALGTGGLLYYAWVIPGAIFALTVAIAYIPFLLALPRRIAAGFVVAGAIFVGGAIGLELFEGYLADNGAVDSAAYMALVIVEEGMEMTGIALFLATAIRHLSTLQPNWQLGGQPGRG